MSAVPQAVPALVIRVLVHATDPVRRQRCNNLMAQLMLTPNWRAAALHDAPAATAATIRTRRSSE